MRRLLDIYQRCNVVVFEPTDFVEAIEPEKWRVAMHEELNMIEKNDTWELVDRRSHNKPIGVKWVYKIKFNPSGSVNKYKARLVIKVYAQTFGVVFSDAFALIAHLDTIRMSLALSTQKGWRFKKKENYSLSTAILKVKMQIFLTKALPRIRFEFLREMLKVNV